MGPLGIALALCGLLAFAAPALAAGEECLACHGQQGLTRKLDKGDTLELHVSPEKFNASIHGALGCSGCHAEVDLKTHPGKPRQLPATAREYTLAASETCKTCHAPVFEAYLGSTHGKGRENGAPVCANCHNPHEVTRASFAVPRETCDTCHAGVVAAHQKWLPNAAHHFEVVACAACHSPGARKKVDLRLFDAAGREVAAGAPTPPRQQPLDETRLAHFMRLAGRDGKVTLVGRLEVPDGAEKHALAPAAKALKDCTACHRKGAEAFQSVTLSLLGSEGERVRYETRQEVLHAPTSVDSVRGFYVIGGTRIGLLDAALGLVLVAGISGPLLHLLLRRLARRNRKQDHA